MTDVGHREGLGEPQHHHQQLRSKPRSYQMAKAATAATAGGSLLVLSGLTHAGTVIALAVATPLLVIFSSLLGLAVIIVFLLATGFLTSGGFGVAATTVLAWLYKIVTRGHPTRAVTLGQSIDKMDLKAGEMKDTGEHLIGEEGVDYSNGAGGSHHELLKAATTATAGGSMLVFSGLMFAVTVIALTAATPPLVTISPVLVPAVISAFLLPTGFFTSGGLGVAATTVFAWLYKYVTGRHPTGAESLDQLMNKLGSKAQDVRGQGEDTIGEGHQETRRVDYAEQGEEGRYKVVKAITTATAGGSLLFISGLTFTGTVIALTLATPLLVIFSPVLVPAMFTTFLPVGFLTSIGLGVAAMLVLSRMSKYVINGHSTMAELLDRMTHKPSFKAQEMRDIGDHTIGEDYNETKGVHYPTSPGESYHKIAKGATAATAGCSLLVLSGLMFVGTIIALTAATPLLVIFSPVLVPTALTTFLLPTGFLTSGGLAVAAIGVLTWMYRYVNGEHPKGEKIADQVITKLGIKAREMLSLRSILASLCLPSGFLTSRAAMAVLRWMSKHLTSGHSAHKPDLKAQEVREVTIDEGDQATKGAEEGHHKVLKATIAVTTGCTLLVFSGVTFVGTIIGLIAATPLLVIFSPVFLPTMITIFLLPTGFLTSGGLGAGAVVVLMWMYKYVTGRHPIGSESLDQVILKFGFKAQEIKETDEHTITEGYQATGGGDYSSGANKMVKAAISATSGSSLLGLSGLTFVGTVIALIMATPLVVMFSPVLVPSAITSFLLPIGFLTAGGFGVAATRVLSSMYKYVVANGQPTSGESLEQVRHKTGFEAHEMRYTDNHVHYSSEAAGGYQKVAKAAATTTMSVSLFVFAGLMFTGTVIGLTVATPVLVISSPILVLSLIAAFLLASGFLTSGGLGVAATTLFIWMYKYMTGGGVDSLDNMIHKLDSKAHETRDEIKLKGDRLASEDLHYTTGVKTVNATSAGGWGLDFS